MTTSSPPITDAALPWQAEARRTAEMVATPRVEAADSFVLHAPLELLARTLLQPLVEPAARTDARERLRLLGDAYASWGTPLPDRPPRSFTGCSDAVAALSGALREGDPDLAQDAATWLGAVLDSDDLVRALADPLVPLLSAAGHASILLYLLPRAGGDLPNSHRLVAGTVREAARYPGWELRWHRDLSPTGVQPRDPGALLAERLRRPASPGDPGSDFIYPVMSLTESSGLARDLLGDVVGALTVVDAHRVLLRIAAHSMLQDDPSHAPYGWSHCLTMPQAVLAVAGACTVESHAIAVAATYVLGFRSILGSTDLDLGWQPERPTEPDALAALDGPPHEAAAAAWHSGARVEEVRARLASRAAVHEDAHLAKYTLACFDAAALDPEAAPLFLAAAAYLGAWWRAADA